MAPDRSTSPPSSMGSGRNRDSGMQTLASAVAASSGSMHNFRQDQTTHGSQDHYAGSRQFDHGNQYNHTSHSFHSYPRYPPYGDAHAQPRSKSHPQSQSQGSSSQGSSIGGKIEPEPLHYEQSLTGITQIADSTAPHNYNVRHDQHQGGHINLHQSSHMHPVSQGTGAADATEPISPVNDSEAMSQLRYQVWQQITFVGWCSIYHFNTRFLSLSMGVFLVDTTVLIKRHAETLKTYRREGNPMNVLRQWHILTGVKMSLFHIHHRCDANG